MLDTDQLTDLYRKHRDEDVLSVYLDADQHDFAERSKWRVVLKNHMAEARNNAEDPEAFDRARMHLMDALESDSGRFLGGRGWVGFATEAEGLHAEPLPVPMPNLVRWERGLRVAPYARALKQSRPITAIILDSRRARVFEYREGALREREGFNADTDLGDLTDVTGTKRASDHTGIRGKTGSDAAQRLFAVERDRLVTRVAEAAGRSIGDDGVVVIGGVERAVAALKRRLGSLGDGRLATRTGLHIDMPDAAVREAVEDAASELSDRRHRDLVAYVLDLARGGGDACLGAEDVERALRARRVRTLVVAAPWRTRQSDLADRFEGTAFDQGAEVVEVGRQPAETLSAEAGGVAALLRYRDETTSPRLARTDRS